MSLPAPPVRLNGHCSVIYDNTLYAYQWNAFQSLSLEDGGKWKKLSLGAPVNGSSCVLGQMDGKDALYVVGGTTNKDKSYSGLQHYTFADKQWTTTQVEPSQSVIQNRQCHGAAFLNSTSSILVYSGFQDDSYTKSSQTFTLSTKAPYTMKSYPASSPPVMFPLVLPWNASHAVMVGGDVQNKEVWIFGEETGWKQVNIEIPRGIQDMKQVQGAIVQGENGSKVLELFDMSQVPNTVTALLIQAENMNSPAPVRRAEVLSSSATEDEEPARKRQRRDVNLGSWPMYNSTLAPKVQRTGFSLAQSSNGLVIVSGGEDDNVDDPFCMFNQTGNSWISAKKFFGVQNSILNPSSTTTDTASVPSLTSAASPATSADIAAAASGTNNSRIILGAVLGGLFGLAAILIIALLVIRGARKRRENHKRRTSDFPPDLKNQMDFDDSGAATGFGPSKHNSSDSKGPMLGNGAQKRGFFHKASDSAGSIFGKKISPPQLQPPNPAPNNQRLTAFPSPFMNSAEHVATRAAGGAAVAAASNSAARTEPRNQGGWSAYFQGENENSRNTAYSNSDYTSESRVTSINPHDSAEVAPLNVRSSQFTAQSWERSRLHPQSGVAISKDYNKQFDDVSEEPERFLDGSSSSGQHSWDPVGGNDGQSTYDQRGSSAYAESFNYHHPGDKVHLGSFPPVPNSKENRGLRSMVTKDFGASSNPPPMPINATALASTPGIRSIIPGSPGAKPRSAGSGSIGKRENTGSDMSWLNLGAGNRS